MPKRLRPIRLRTIVGDRRGAAAIEFAMIAPVMVLMYIGALDVTRGVMASRKVNLLARTISDLVAQQATANAMPSSQISLIFTTASALMAPYDTSSLKITVSAIDIKAKTDKTCCQALVRWSYTQGGTLRPCTTPLTLVDPGTPSAPTNIPNSIVVANNQAGYNYAGGLSSYLIVTDVGYTYSPFFQQAVSWFSGGFTKTIYMVPRSPNGTVTLASPVNAAAGQSGTICF